MSRSTSSTGSSTSNHILHHHPLSQAYQSISNQTCQLATCFINSSKNKEGKCQPWPHADSFTRHLDKKNDNNDNDSRSSSSRTTGHSGLKYTAPSFPDGDGPVGVFALCPRNPPQASRLVDHCMQHGWGPFCRDLQQIFHDYNNDDNSYNNINTMQGYLYPSPLMHATLAIFQEHPRILDDEGKKQWQHIDDERMEILIQRLDEFIQNDGNFPKTIPLVLDALVLTPDGAMIAGFVEQNIRSAKDGDDHVGDDGDIGHFARLRTGLIETAKDVLGSVSSRPKNLIHISLGRILGLPLPPPPSLSPASSQQYEQYNEKVLQVQQLVCHYNQQVFPRVVRDLKERGGGALPLRDFSLARNSVWLCEENVFYKSWQLDSSSSSSSSSP
jgi:hypothetical protein